MPAFCVWIHLIVDTKLHSGSCLFELIVVAHCAFGVDDHSRRHRPRPRTHSKVVLPLLNPPWAVIYTCSAFSYRVFHQNKKLWASSGACAENTAAYVDLCPQDAADERFNWLNDARMPRLCQPSRFVGGEPVCMCVGSSIRFSEIDQVFFDCFPSFIAEFIESWVRKFGFRGPFHINVFPSPLFASCLFQTPYRSFCTRKRHNDYWINERRHSRQSANAVNAA